MTHISISIDFLLDVRNSLNTLGALINDETFVSVISMAPGAAIVARTISSLSNKIIQAFMEPEERKPILQFHGDLNIASREVQEGYYVILGTCDKSSPIPRPLPRLEVQNGDLLADGNAVTQWSYVIFEVRVLPARTRDLNDGAEWDLRIREAEDEALVVAHDPLADAEQRRLAWDSVSELLKEAQVLLRADPNYLREEASKIIKKVYVDCYQQIFDTYPSSVVTSLGPVRGKGSISLARPDSAGRRYLGIPEDEDLSAIVNRYKTEVMESRQIIASEKIQ
jgi:hypothetical protein